MLKYLVYCRKSSEEEDRQVASIERQTFEMERLHAANSLFVAGTLFECRSAKEPGRPVFNEMLSKIESGEANAILTWKLDRLARNFEDAGRVIGLLQRGVIKEIRTFERTYLPADNVLTMAVEFGMANQYVRDLSMNIRSGIEEKVRRGVFPGRAPLGYMNDPKLRAIVPHPRFFKRVKRILELFATGEYSINAIQREFTKAGLVGNNSGKPLHCSSVHTLLAKPFYYGVFLLKGEMHQGTHTPMISKSTFDDIQKARHAIAKPRNHRKENKGLLFLNFATCDSCGYSISGERHVKRSGLRFAYYRCSHKSRAKRCENRTYIRTERFQAEVQRNAELVTLPNEWKEKYLARIEAWESEGALAAKGQLTRLQKQLSAAAG